MVFFDIEIAKQSDIDVKDYELLREQYNGFDFMPEFNQIICICYYESGANEVKSLTWDEKDIIKSFFEIASSDFLCGYNIKWFDIPFIVKRAVILGIRIPNSFKLYGKKPWDMTGIDDIYEVWKHMSGKACSLDTLCGALNIQTPKDKMNGAQVDEYFRDGKLNEIVEYCVKDVQVCVKVRTHFLMYNLI